MLESKLDSLANNSFRGVRLYVKKWKLTMYQRPLELVMVNSMCQIRGGFR